MVSERFEPVGHWGARHRSALSMCKDSPWLERFQAKDALQGLRRGSRLYRVRYVRSIDIIGNDSAHASFQPLPFIDIASPIKRTRKRCTV